MKLPSLAIRQQLVTFLAGITYLTKTIPVFEEYVQYTTTKPETTVMVGNMQVEVYIILTNQTANDASNTKCTRKDECSIQIQAYAVFPANKGGSKTTEEIMQLVLDKFYTADNLNTAFTLSSPFEVINSEVITTGNTNFNTDTNRVWSTISIVNINVNQ
jgi:hypothetical protein